MKYVLTIHLADGTFNLWAENLSAALLAQSMLAEHDDVMDVELHESTSRGLKPVASEEGR